MSVATLSPVSPEPPSPKLMFITDVEPSLHPANAPVCPDMAHQSLIGASSLGPKSNQSNLTDEESITDPVFSQRTKKLPPLHTGADWKVVLHLPEIEKWLRATSDRVAQLTHSVGQDTDNRHVDVHLVQLKDICEDISDHVEQIHALLETEFSLKLLSYSVNIIVDIRTVQLLWHQLRVSVLVLKERLLQGLQDPNGNYTRQTDILQAFSQDQHQTRLDALTEVDDCGQLTIRCSQDYFSLDCGITAFELSDYSPSDHPEDRGTESTVEDTSQNIIHTTNSNLELHKSLPQHSLPSDIDNHTHSTSETPTNQSDMPKYSESSKRPLQAVSHSTESSPTQPSLPKRAALFSNKGTKSRGSFRKARQQSELQHKAELSQSTPSLVNPPDRSKFWLELDSVDLRNLPQSNESLQKTIEDNLKNHHMSSTHRKPEGSSGANDSLPVCRLMSLDEISTQTERRQKRIYAVSMGDSDSSLPSPISEQLLSSDLEASGEESDAQRGGSRNAGWTVNRQGHKKGSQVPSERIQSREHWYGSDEFLALPAQLHETEMLAVKLESLIQSSTLQKQRGLQDVDDWELSELNVDWDAGENGVNTRNIVGSGDYGPSPLLSLHPHRQTSVSCFSSSSSDVAPSLEDSRESGPLSDLQSGEEQSRRSVDGSPQLTAPLVDGRGCASLMKKLLDDIQDQNEGIWVKMECFVQKLDGFISWLQEALDSTENWMQPRQDLDSLRVYLDTHLTFKLNVDSQHALKESILAEGKSLLSIITSHQLALKDILHMVGSQWDQLQWQIRRQHGWMLRALRCIQTRLLYTSHSQQPCASNGQFPCLAEDLKVERNSTECNIQQVALETMSVRLKGLHYPSSSRRYNRSSSLQEFEAEYQELWEWLMDMDAMVTDSHQLMMSEEQRHHLFKSSLAELLMMESRKTSLLRQAASLKRIGTELPSNLHIKIHNLTHTWQQLEKILSEHSVPCSSEQKLSSNANTLLVAGQDVAAKSPRSALSPMTNSLLEQLEARIKELKAWLRDTELLIFNSCLRQETCASEQLSSFKSLCSEIGSRRRGVASVLKLCQKLLQQSQSGLMAEVGPDAEQHREALQLLSINLERRWEAIVMQALQWQNRLKRELGEQQVNGNILETGLVDLHQISPVSVASVTVPPEDSWEWDETDMSVMEAERLDVPQPDLTTNLPTALQSSLPSNNILATDNQPVEIQTDIQATQLKEFSNLKDGSSMDVNSHSPPNNNVYQVYSLHSIELCKQLVFPLPSTLMHINKPVKNKEHFLLKSISKDSSLSSIESLPDLLGGLMSSSQQRDRISEFCNRESEGGRRSGQSENSLRSDCESGIVSDNGDSETSSNSGVQGKKEDQWIERKEKRDRRKGEVTQEHYSLALEKNCIAPYKRSKMQMSTNLEEWRRNELRCEIKRNKKEEKKRCKQDGGEAVEFLINGHGILTPANSDSDIDVKGLDDSKMFMSQRDNTECNPGHYNSSETPPALNSRTSSPVLSQSSSLESLLALGIDLFPSKERLHHSVSLESCLNPCHSPNREAVGSLTSPDEMNPCQEKDQDRINLRASMDTETEESSGELSQRTLDLLKRLENIQNPLVGKMTRSVSDMSIQSSIPQKYHFPVSPSLGGQHTPLSRLFSTSWKGQPSLINENLSKMSLTELSSTEDSSLASEDFIVLRNQHPLFLDPNIATSSSPRRKHCHNGNRGGKAVDESDAASLSMVVNVSCTSACTDEDEDDSDLLSSSTLTLTEEELGVRDEQDGDDDRVNGLSSGNEEDEDNDEDDMENSYELGLEYMKRELQSWIRPPRTSVSSSFKSEAGLLDELQCGSAPPSTFTYSRAQLMDSSNKAGGNTSRNEREDETRLNVTRSYISQFVDDVENGNIDHSCLQGKDEDDELLQEESGLFTQKRDTLRDFYVNTKTEDQVEDVGNLRVEMDSVSTSHICSSPSSELHPFSSKRTSCLVGELRGELPCHSASFPSPPLLSPVNCRSHNALDNNFSIAGGRKAITIQEKFKFSSLVTEETRREVRAKDSSLPSKKGHKSHASCCKPFVLSASTLSVDESKKENVHDFVMEIIDMASVALKSKENQSDGATQRETSGSVPDQSSTSLAHIRDKVLEHSHRPLHLRKGDFYSYLSLSSHDSDCGEVSQCAEDKSLTPVPYTIPSYCTSTPTPNSPSPELFPSSKVAMSSFQSSQLSRRSSPNLTAKDYIGSLDLKCFDGEPGSVSDGSRVEQQSSSPSLSVPTSPDFRNEETLFEACTEEVYLGPPLCYSMVIKKKPQPSYHKLRLDTSLAGGCELIENGPCLSQEGKSSKLDNRRTDHLFSTQGSGSRNETQNFYLPEPCYSLFSSSSLLRSNFSSSGDNLFSPLPVSTEAMEEKLGEDLYLSSDGVVGKVATAVSVSMPQEERSRNEGPSYLNPWVRVALIDSFATECLADTKTLESNMGTVMTKISVCSSATNPSKEPATAATRINPKINCSAMRRPDREEGKRSKEEDTRWAEEEEKRRKGWSVSQQEAKSALVKQAGFWPVHGHSVGGTQDEANPQ
ncbi:A-kinase anchor protein 6 isoform X1 [Xiphophorus hellerii]|uniref:A-kinase anchor protein 6 isoform X1 n=1 Tax=Xiphophorus hellerii TaxID=8084 RepID=UPI0013B3E59C|nr:A-kinase anchor protein 6 isoform X1 [Xiphophorus hellerii]XP_032404170.1 A-kinase anchor protein 6 isoform X1 [Xiphophorus hellerii]